MTLTIQLDNSLIAQLKKKASSAQLPIEELATQLLADAIARLDSAERWAPQNQRRLALIHKSVSATLSEAEQIELDTLQLALDQQLDSVDDKLLDTLHTMKHAVADLSTNQT